MAVIVYQPKPGGRYLAPGLKPGDELSVSAHEAKRLIATGAFKAPEKPEPDEPKPESRRTKKEQK